jgi:hypothetical protein
MNKYQNELQELKPWDEVCMTILNSNGYDFIPTAGHGYMVVPKNNKNYNLAKKITKLRGIGFVGNLAVYLEEDTELSEFIKSIKE